MIGSSFHFWVLPRGLAENNIHQVWILPLRKSLEMSFCSKNFFLRTLYSPPDVFSNWCFVCCMPSTNSHCFLACAIAWWVRFLFIQHKVSRLESSHFVSKSHQKKIEKFRKNHSRNIETLLGIVEEGIYGGSFLPATPPSTSGMQVCALPKNYWWPDLLEMLIFRRNGTYLHFCRPNGIRRNGYKPCS